MQEFPYRCPKCKNAWVTSEESFLIHSRVCAQANNTEEGGAGVSAMARLGVPKRRWFRYNPDVRCIEWRDGPDAAQAPHNAILLHDILQIASIPSDKEAKLGRATTVSDPSGAGIGAALKLSSAQLLSHFYIRTAARLLVIAAKKPQLRSFWVQSLRRAVFRHNWHPPLLPSGAASRRLGIGETAPTPEEGERHLDKTVSGLSVFPLFSARGATLDPPENEGTSKRFLKEGVNITPTLFEPLFAEDNQELCKLVLNGEACSEDLDLHGNCGLHLTARLGDSAGLTKTLVQSGCSVNRLNLREESPLLVAIYYDNRPMVEALLANSQLEVDLVCAGGMSALHAAAMMGYSTILESLLTAGGNASLLDVHGWSPLHFACFAAAPLSRMIAHANSGSHGDCVALLCDFAAETVDLSDKENDNTPLHTAAGSGTATCVRILLETAANPSLLNKKNCTPEMLARAEAHTDCIQILHEYSLFSTRRKVKAVSTMVGAANAFKHTKCVGSDRRESALESHPLPASPILARTKGGKSLGDILANEETAERSSAAYKGATLGETVMAPYDGADAEIAVRADGAGLEPPWQMCYTEEGDAYYYNEETGESEWDYSQYVDAEDEGGAEQNSVQENWSELTEGHDPYSSPSSKYYNGHDLDQHHGDHAAEAGGEGGYYPHYAEMPDATAAATATYEEGYGLVESQYAGGHTYHHTDAASPLAYYEQPPAVLASHPAHTPVHATNMHHNRHDPAAHPSPHHRIDGGQMRRSWEGLQGHRFRKYGTSPLSSPPSSYNTLPPHQQMEWQTAAPLRYTDGDPAARIGGNNPGQGMHLNPHTHALPPSQHRHHSQQENARHRQVQQEYLHLPSPKSKARMPPLSPYARTDITPDTSDASEDDRKRTVKGPSQSGAAQMPPHTRSEQQYSSNNTESSDASRRRRSPRNRPAHPPVPVIGSERLQQSLQEQRRKERAQRRRSSHGLQPYGAQRDPRGGQQKGLHPLSPRGGPHGGYQSHDLHINRGQKGSPPPPPGVHHGGYQSQGPQMDTNYGVSPLQEEYYYEYDHAPQEQPPTAYSQQQLHDPHSHPLTDPYHHHVEGDVYGRGPDTGLPRHANGADGWLHRRDANSYNAHHENWS